VSIQNSSVVTQISGGLLVLCHQRQDFQLKMHHKAFGGWTPLDILAGLREGDGRERGKEGVPLGVG